MLTTDNSRFKNRTDHPLSHYGLLISHQIVLFKKITTAAGFPSTEMDLLSFYFKSYLILGSLCCYSLFIILYWTKVLKLWDDFFTIIVLIQTTDVNRSRSPWSTSQSYFIINILPQGVVLTLLPLQIHLFHFSHHSSLPKTLPFNLLKDLWLIIPEKTFQLR